MSFWQFILFSCLCPINNKKKNYKDKYNFKTKILGQVEYHFRSFNRSQKY